MTKGSITDLPGLAALCGLLVLMAAQGLLAAEPAPVAVSAFDSYIRTVEARLARQHGSPTGFLTVLDAPPDNESRLRQGELMVEKLAPSAGLDLPGAMLHHWRGAAFVPEATAADFERLMKDFSAYPQHFSPQVQQATVLMQQGDHFEASMRVRQRHILTVVMDTTCDITFSKLDARHGYSISRSTRVDEIGAAGQEHGFLWRLNTYWSYEERDGGLYVEIESVSLTRSIPRGLSWLVGPFVESVPRESLQFTLRSVLNALRK
jgi:hypothetical protein